MEGVSSTRILGVRVDRLSIAQALDAFEKLMNSEGCSLIVTPNAEIVEKASGEREFREVIENADLVLPDGVGLLYASRMKRRPEERIEEKIAGIDFAFAALKACAASGKKVFLFGGKEGVAEAAAEKLRESIPGLDICGCACGYFKAKEEGSIVEAINAAGTDFLCAALGAPKQEFFIYRNRDRLKARAAIGIGGSLDVWSGSLRRAPDFYRKNGLEWFYRMVQEPGRLKRFPALVKFLVKAAIRR